jgi:hypothetical protein
MSQLVDERGERRASSRYNLALPAGIRLSSNPTSVGSIPVKTRDISTHGFYFDIMEKLAIGTTFEFSIALPIEVTGTTQAYVSGKARAVRIEETDANHPDRLGVGALIESYQISRQSR